jgi:hypothetical protein
VWAPQWQFKQYIMVLSVPFALKYDSNHSYGQFFFDINEHGPPCTQINYKTVESFTPLKDLSLNRSLCEDRWQHQ